MIFLAVAKPFTAKSSQRLLSPHKPAIGSFLSKKDFFREYKDLEVEKTSWLLGEGNWLYSVESYITSKPAEYYLQALTKATKLLPRASLTIRNVQKVLLGIHPNKR